MPLHLFGKHSRASYPQPADLFIFHEDGPVTILVGMYNECATHTSADFLPIVHYGLNGPLASGCVVNAAGELFFPPGDSDGDVQASQLTVLGDATIARQSKLAPASFVVLGTLSTIVDRDWFFEVAVYERSVSHQLKLGFHC